MEADPAVLDLAHARVSLLLLGLAVALQFGGVYASVLISDAQLDNPDVRIAEDVRDSVASALGLSLSLLASMVTLVSFGAMLWSLSSAWALPIAGDKVEIPGLMLWIAVAFALFSMWITNRVGRKLILLDFDRIRVEADFRYAYGQVAGGLAWFVNAYQEIARWRANIERPPRERMLFLSRRPYLPIGSLRAAVCYPSHPGTFPDEQMVAALHAFGLDALATRLDDDQPWEQKLSAHEQQRLALARVLLQQPDWIVFDEATSDLDDATEAKAYEVLAQQLPNAEVLAVAERAGALARLPRRWTLTESAGGRVALAVT